MSQWSSALFQLFSRQMFYNRIIQILTTEHDDS